MLTIRRVSGPDFADELYDLQAKCLPVDAPCHVDIGWWWLAFDDDTPAGFGSLCASNQYAERGYLCRAGTLPEFRGRGIQKRLIRVREAYARRLGFGTIVTDTFQNAPSSNALISCGFKLYDPRTPWSFPGALYWHKTLT